MIQSLLKFLNNLSIKTVLRINTICIILFFILLKLEDTFHFKNEFVIISSIPITWLSFTLLLSTAVAKVVSSEEAMKNKWSRLAISLGVIMIIISLIGPIILYYQWLQTGEEIERLKQIIQQHQ